MYRLFCFISVLICVATYYSTDVDNGAILPQILFFHDAEIHLQQQHNVPPTTEYRKNYLTHFSSVQQGKNLIMLTIGLF